MDKFRSDTFVKPDMTAILERFHLPVNEIGFLLSVFKVLSNAAEGIEMRHGPFAAMKGHVSIRFENLMKLPPN